MESLEKCVVILREHIDRLKIPSDKMRDYEQSCESTFSFDILGLKKPLVVEYDSSGANRYYYIGSIFPPLSLVQKRSHDLIDLIDLSY